MRKFKHVKTGIIATSLEIAGRVYKYDAGQAASFYILEDMLENSNDWEEIKNLLVVTYDGVKLYEGDTCYCTHGNDDNTVREIVADSSNTFYYSIKDVPVFAKKENAEEYILFRKPCLSLRDLLSVWGDKDEIELSKTSPLFLTFKELAKNLISGDKSS